MAGGTVYHGKYGGKDGIPALPNESVIYGHWIVDLDGDGQKEGIHHFSEEEPLSIDPTTGKATFRVSANHDAFGGRGRMVTVAESNITEPIGSYTGPYRHVSFRAVVSFPDFFQSLG